MWGFGNIEFSDYGVYVASAQGLMDFPKLLDDGHDWLDEDGREYWREPKYVDRDILLNCFMIAEPDGAATAYVTLLEQMEAFSGEIRGAGKTSLVTPYKTFDDCTITTGIQTTRHTGYVNNIQYVVFTLRVTVHGDSNYLQVDIKRWTGSETITAATVFTNNLKVNKALQGDYTATMQFESSQKLPIKFFDYIEVNSNGVHLDVFHLTAEPDFRKLSSNKFSYSLTFFHQNRWLESSQFANDRGETDFYYFANLEEIVDLIITNHNRGWFGNFVKGTIEHTERKNHKFMGENCLDVLKRLCADYDVEYEFGYVQPGKYQINVSEHVGDDLNLTIEYGKGKGAYEVSREAVRRDEVCTVLFAFGSTKNIPPTYRGGLQRLSFDGNPISNNAGLHDGAGAQEKTVFFDDIYPNFTSDVTDFEWKLPEDFFDIPNPAHTLTKEEEMVWPMGFFRVEDSEIPFDINDYLLGGLTAKIRMKTGELAGYEFEIQRYDDDTNSMFIIPFKDERGDIYPNADFLINEDDEYTLVDIDQPAEYIEVAEAELEAAAEAYLASSSDIEMIFPYRVIVDPKLQYSFDVGDKIDLIDEDFNIDDKYRVANLTYDVGLKIFELYLSDTARLTRRQQTEMRMRAVERAQRATQSDKPENMRRGGETTKEVKNRLLNPRDDKLNTDQVLRVNSVDARAVGLDAISIQWAVEGLWFQADDEENKVTWTAGRFIVSNWGEYTKQRYEIDKDVQDDVDYDPSKTWNIPAGEWELPAGTDVYFVYVRIPAYEREVVNGDENDGEVLFFKKTVYVRRVAGYLTYKIGEIQRDA